MAIDLKTIERVAKVARINLTEEELKGYAEDLEEILEAFSILDEAPECERFDFNPVQVENILRDDEAHLEIDPAVLRELLQTVDDRVRGPRVI